MNQAIKALSTLAFALVFMAGAAFAQARQSNATINQTSNNSEAYISQTIEPQVTNEKVHNQATIDQTGDYHSAEITQNNRGQYAAQQISDPNKNNYGNYAEITQTGNDGGDEENGNHAEIEQRVGSDQQAFLWQDGLRNDAQISQRKGNLFGSFEAKLDAGIQHGNDNKLIVNQNLNYSDVGVSQYGDNNDAQIDQPSTNSVARILQDGVTGGQGNSATISQFKRGEAEVQQMGDGHSADVTQEVGSDNSAKVVQKMQNASASGAMVTQSGALNTVDVLQKGSSLTVTQAGSNNEVVGLGGLGTTANVFGGSLTVDQTNDGNMAYVNMTSGGAATVMQDGTSNMAEVVQN